MKRFVELALVIIGVLAPQFILASEVDGDEFAKATSGVMLAGVVLGAYKVFRSQEATSSTQ